MTKERKYFLAHGKSEQIVRDFFARRAAAFDAANALANEVGGMAGAVSYRMVGVVFDGDPPAGWTKRGEASGGKPYYAPLRKSKAGKEIHRRMADVYPPRAGDLHHEFVQDGGVLEQDGANVMISYISAEIVGESAILTVPASMDFSPPDALPLKTSEYWALKERVSDPTP